MFIPLGTNRPSRRKPYVTQTLIVLNMVVFLLQMVTNMAAPAKSNGDMGEGWINQTFTLQFELQADPGLNLTDEEMGFISNRFYGGDVPKHRPWQWVSYQFLHGSIMHILGNMLFLWVFGPPLEDRLKKRGFIALYLFGGFGAALAHMLFAGISINENGTITHIPSVLGASGSVAALTGAFLVLFPLTRIRVLLFFVIIGMYMIPAWVFIGIAVARDLFGLAGAGRSNIAFEAHLGGYAFGAAVVAALLWLKIIAREPTYDLLSIGRQAKRRRDFRAAVAGAQRDHASGQSSPWMGDTGRGGSVGRSDGKSEKEAAEDEARAQDRAKMLARVREELRADRHGHAARAFKDLVSKHDGVVLSRDDQLSIAKALYEEGDATNAAAAFETFLARYKGDAECQQVRILLAMIYTRVLNDPVRASALLEKGCEVPVPAELQPLVQSLRQELGGDAPAEHQ